MNLLTEQLPGAVEIDGKAYPIKTDFRDCLAVIMAFEDPELTTLEKQLVLLNNMYQEPIENLQSAIEQAIKFLNGGALSSEKSNSPRLYSFAKDGNFIFSAFKQTHGIDLTDIPYLHWWKFLALFTDLGSETTFCNLVGLRKRVKDGTATKEERKTAREMGEIFEVPEIDNRTLEEREQEVEFLRLVSRSGQE